MGNLPKNATMDAVLLVGITTRSTLAKKDNVGIFGLKTVVHQNSVHLGMISARHSANRQSFKKVTCPFNHDWFIA